MPKYYYHSYLFEFKYVYIVLKGIVFRINKENCLQFNFNLYLWLYHNFRHYRNVDTTHQCFFDCQQIGLLVCCTPHFQIIANFDNNSIIASAWTHTFILLNGSNYQNMTQEEGIYYFFFFPFCYALFVLGLVLALSHLCAEFTKESSSRCIKQRHILHVHDCRRVKTAF